VALFLRLDVLLVFVHCKEGFLSCDMILDDGDLLSGMEQNDHDG